MQEGTSRPGGLLAPAVLLVALAVPAQVAGAQGTAQPVSCRPPPVLQLHLLRCLRETA